MESSKNFSEIFKNFKDFSDLQGCLNGIPGLIDLLRLIGSSNSSLGNNTPRDRKPATNSSVKNRGRAQNQTLGFNSNPRKTATNSSETLSSLKETPGKPTKLCSTDDNDDGWTTVRRHRQPLPDKSRKPSWSDVVQKAAQESHKSWSVPAMPGTQGPVPPVHKALDDEAMNTKPLGPDVNNFIFNKDKFKYNEIN